MATRTRLAPAIPTREVIRIEGDCVEIERIESIRKVSLAGWIEQIKATSQLETPILPSGTIYFKVTATHRVYVIQLQPGIRTIEWNKVEGCETLSHHRDDCEEDCENDHFDEDIQNRWTLALPFLQFIVPLTQAGAVDVECVRIYATKVPIRDLAEKLFHAPLGNIYAGIERPCTGHMSLDEGLQTDAAKVEDFVGKFLTSPFNADLSQPILPVASWQRRSKDNELFGIAELPLQPARSNSGAEISLGEVLRNVG